MKKKKNRGKIWICGNLLRYIKKNITRPSNYLAKKSRIYRKWLGFKFHKHIHILVSVVLLITVLAVFGSIIVSHVLAFSSWIQSDWSGGVGASTTNQYSSQTNVNTTTANQVTLATSSSWSSTYSYWLYRQPITIDNVGSAVTSYQVRLNVTYSAGMNADFSDIRFTNSSDTALPYWIESETNSTSAIVWVKVDSLIATGNTTIYMYYGNSQATSASNGTNTFLLFDAFNGNSLNTSLWTASGTGFYSENSSGLTISNGNGYWSEAIYSNQAFTRSNLAMDVDYDWTNEDNSYNAIMFGWKDNTTGTSYPNLVYGYYNQGTSSPIAPLVYEGGNCETPCANLPGAWATNTPYLVSVRMLATGGAEYLQSTNYGQTWTTSYSDINSTATNLHPAIVYYAGGTHVFSNLRVRQWMSTEPTSSFGSVQGNYSTSGTLISNIFNTGIEENYGTLSFSDSVPSGTSVSVFVRAGNNANLSDAPNWTSCTAINSGSSIVSGGCAPNGKQYVQYELQLTGNDLTTPTLTSITIPYTPFDTVPPATNATNLLAFDGNAGASVSSDSWANVDPYFTWTAATDHNGGSGIAGYCLYLGSSSTGNPTTSSGHLGSPSPLNTGGACPYAVSSTSLDTSLAGILATPLTSSTAPYYLNIDAITNAGIIWNNSPAQFEFLYDNTPPTNPAFVTAPSEFVSTPEVTLTWPTSGADSASDTISGIAGLQYRIGSNGTWYGVNHSGTQDSTDLLPNDGSYTTISNPDYNNLVQGNNIVYFRTWNNAGDVSSAYVTAVIKINTTSPSSPQNLTASPTTNITNSFGFSWLAPASFTGSASNIVYCYTINTLPNSNNCNYTAAGQTSLSAGAYATEPGDNTIYLVARDEAGNINYATATSTTFTANTPAPGIPLNTDIADISVKSTSTWKLAVSWNPPSTVGAGIASYRVFRSTNGTNYSQLATTAGTSYVDTGLTQQTYYYEVEACDSANNCGGFTSPVSDYPTGKFTAPANLISGPDVTVNTRSVTITWTTDRTSDSSIEYGLVTNQYSSTEATNSNQVTSHSITLDNLQPGTTYYYRAQWDDNDGNLGTSSENVFTTLPAPTVSNVNVLSVNLTSATIQFTSDGANSATIYYGQSKGFGLTQTINTSTDSSTYVIALNQLSSGSTYYFKIDPFDVQGNEYQQTIFSFNTPPQPVISNIEFSPVPGALTGTEEVFWTTNVPTSSQISYGPLNGTRSNQLDTTLTTSHEMTISDLNYNTQYSLTATSVDALGDVANSDLQVFKSGIDTRPPVISDVVIQPSIVGNGASAKGQLIVSWKTDKAGTSQVAYGNGGPGDYTTTTAANTQLVNNHVVVITGVSTSEVYHVEVISNDADGIKGVSADQTTIIGQASDNALSIVFNSLQSIFGL